MRGRILILAILVGVALLGWQFSGSKTSPNRDTDSVALEEDANAVLHGRAEQDDPSAGRAVESEPSRARTWTLHVALWKSDPSKRPPLVLFSRAEDKNAPASPFAGRLVQVVLRRGTDSRELARGSLNRQGRARFLLPGMESMTELARAASEIHVVPLDEDIHVAPPRGLEISVARGYVRAARPVALPADAHVVLHLTVPVYLGNVVRGQAVWPDGSPARHVMVQPHSGDGGEAPDTCTDEQGHFVFPVVSGGTFSVLVDAPDGSRVTVNDVRLTTGAGADLGVLSLRSEGDTFAGRIVYPDGAPVEGLLIRGMVRHRDLVASRGRLRGCGGIPAEPHCRTDTDGRFRLTPGIGTTGPRQIWWLYPSVRGGAKLTPTFGFDVKPSEDLNSVLHGHRVRFDVRDEEGHVVPNAQIQIRPALAEASGKPLPRAIVGHTDDLGQRDFFLPSDTDWAATILARGASPKFLTVHVPKDRNESIVRIPLAASDPDSGIRISLTDAHGATLLPAQVELKTLDGARVWSGRVAKDGDFVPAAAGTYLVRIRSFEKAPWANGRGRWLHHRQQVEVVAGKATVLTPTASQAAHLQVTLKIAPKTKGLPAHPSVHLTHDATGRRERSFVAKPTRYESDVQAGVGIVRHELEPGWWSVRLDAIGFRSVTRRVELVAGELGAIEFVLEPD